MSWRVVRQDDNGNEFVMAETETRAAAEAIAATFEARAHKQIYTVVEVSPSDASAKRD